MYIALTNPKAQVSGSFSFSSPLLATQMNAAFAIVNATSPDQVKKQMSFAMEFADHYDFYLPAPRHNPLQISADQYQKHVVPWFAHYMRERFDNELQKIQESKSPFTSFRQQGLLDVKLPDIACSGLITFDLLNDTLMSVEEDAHKLEETLPATNSKIFTYPMAVLKSPWLHGLIVSGLIALFGARISMAVAIGILWSIIERGIIKEHFHPQSTADKNGNEDLTKAIDIIQQNRVRLACFGLSTPAEIVLPAPTTGELFTAAFLKNAKEEGKNVSKLNDKIAVIEGARDLKVFVDEHVHYVIVKSPGTGKIQLRIIHEDFEHSTLVLKGEEIVCGGGFFCRRGDSKDTYSLMIDASFSNQEVANSDSISVMNNRSSIKDVIGEAFRTKLSNNVEIRISTEGWNSDIWEAY
ncbi:MAG: hypothetical protein ABH871_00835 [Pseudomonadota bacterium]